MGMATVSRPSTRPRLTLVVNAGSSSLKAALFAGDPGSDTDGTSPEPRWSVRVDTASVANGVGTNRIDEFERVLRAAPDLDEVGVVGHRVVHGGRYFERPVLLDAGVEATITELEELAPLHNRAALDGLAAARRLVASDTPHVAVFDTAFHYGLPDAAAAYGGPYGWFDQGLRRYGFHGISHRYASVRAATILRRPLDTLRLVTCHLGGGCSLAAIDRGRSVDTTMGFTPLDGLVMATRAGSVDPGLILHLLRSGTPIDELAHLLEAGSGLLGLSGVSGDLREVTNARDGGDPRAVFALDVFVHRVVTGVGAMIAALGGIDAIVFTGGIGENSPEVRARVSERFGFLGADLDEATNAANSADADLSKPTATVALVTVRANEELAIARDAFCVMGDGGRHVHQWPTG